MFVNNFFVSSSNPFFNAYIHSDFLGKLIFIGLIVLSIVTWVLIIQKGLSLYLAKKNAVNFYRQFQSKKNNLLNFDYNGTEKQKKINPFLNLYQLFKKQTIDVLNKNKVFIGENKGVLETVFLTRTDIDFIEAQAQNTMAAELKILEKNLFVLSTIVSLAPFLGLLGTVWGILITFSEMQTMTSGSTHEMMLGGLSLALATTVIGLIDAIPALIAYNYFKNAISEFEMEMEGFSTEMISSIEMNYRQVDVAYG